MVWGIASADGTARQCFVTVESFAVVEKFFEILEALRKAMARLRYDYEAGFMIALKAPRLEFTPAQKQLEEKFRDEQDAAEYERRQR